LEAFGAALGAALGASCFTALPAAAQRQKKKKAFIKPGALAFTAFTASWLFA